MKDVNDAQLPQQRSGSDAQASHVGSGAYFLGGFRQSAGAPSAVLARLQSGQQRTSVANGNADVRTALDSGVQRKEGCSSAHAEPLTTY